MRATLSGPRARGSRRLPGRRPAPVWRQRLHRVPGMSRCFRVGVFVVGLVLVLGGAGLWMFSLLLCLPVVLAGLWTWSREFHWGHRLYAAVRARARLVWTTARARPRRAALLSVVGLASGVGVSWLAASAHVVERVVEALGP